MLILLCRIGAEAAGGGGVLCGTHPFLPPFGILFFLFSITVTMHYVLYHFQFACIHASMQELKIREFSFHHLNANLLWPGTFAFSHWLLDHQSLLHTRRILELGRSVSSPLLSFFSVCFIIHLFAIFSEAEPELWQSFSQNLFNLISRRLIMMINKLNKI